MSRARLIWEDPPTDGQRGKGGGEELAQTSYMQTGSLVIFESIGWTTSAATLIKSGCDPRQNSLWKIWNTYCLASISTFAVSKLRSPNG